MNGKRLKIYNNGELIHEAKECSVPFETPNWHEVDPVINEISTEPMDSKQFQYVEITVNNKSVGLMDHRHWSDEDWGILLALIKKYQ